MQQQLICNMQRAAAQAIALIVLDQLTEPDAGVVTAQMRRSAGRHGAEIPQTSDFCRFPRLCR